MDKITEKDFEVLNQPEADTPLDFATVKLREHQTAVEKVEKQKALDNRMDKTTPSKEVMLKNMSDIDVMSMNLMTSEVKTTQPDLEKLNDRQLTKVRSQNIDNYSKQIKTNILVGVKAIFLVCRDLVEAERNLFTEDFQVLKETLPLTDGTISKYMTIGKSKLCNQLFQIGKMPDTWTTMYKIASVSESDKQKKLLENVNIDTTAEDVDVMIDKAPKNVSPPLWNYSLNKPKDFLKISFENNKDFADVDPNILIAIKNKVSQVVKDITAEMKLENLDYIVSNNDKETVVEVVADTTLFGTLTEKVLNHYEKKMKGKTAETYAVNFLNKQKEINGEMSTPLSA